MFIHKQFATLVACLALLISLACSTVHAPEIDSLEGIGWLRSFGDGGEDGFYLAEDGRLLYLNIFSMTGDRWERDGAKLTMSSHTERYPEPQKINYTYTRKGATLSLLMEDGEKPIEYKAAAIENKLDDTRWAPGYVKSPGSSAKPEGEAIYLQFDVENKKVSGFAGVNRFQGGYETTGAIGIKIGPLMATKKFGPGMEYEEEFLRNIQSADTFLILDGTLCLYEGTTIVAAFSSEK